MQNVLPESRAYAHTVVILKGLSHQRQCLQCHRDELISKSPTPDIHDKQLILHC